MGEKSVPQALLFIPDISGFTQFVSEMEISHSQHIIEELLETLIDSNELGMKVSEIEGDAIFFYLLCESVTPGQIASQSRKMFIAFHQHLRKYEMSRICDCGACLGASRLTLKMVAHHGEVTFSKIKDYVKLFGSNVILIHRLLKNDITDHEYLLATDTIPLKQLKDEKDNFSWVHPMEGKGSYDVGEVSYWYTPFADLHNQVPEPRKPEIKRYQVKNPWKYTIEIDASLPKVWELLTDLPKRIKFMAGVKKVVIHDEPHNIMNKIGTRHECIRGDGTADMVTSHFERTDHGGIFSETAADQAVTCDYVVESHNGKIQLTILFHVAARFPGSVFARIFMKPKMDGYILETMKNFKMYCEEFADKPISRQPA